MHPDPGLPAPRWRVDVALPVLKFTGAALFVALGILLAGGDPVRVGLAVLAAAALLGWGVRDVLTPVRLAVDPAGVTVISGLAGRRHIPWTAVERIVVDTRPRLGLRSETLEIDAGTSLHLFTRYDLGTSPEEVAAVLRAVRSADRPGDPAG